MQRARPQVPQHHLEDVRVPVEKVGAGARVSAGRAQGGAGGPGRAEHDGQHGARVGGGRGGQRGAGRLEEPAAHVEEDQVSVALVGAVVAVALFAVGGHGGAGHGVGEERDQREKDLRPLWPTRSFFIYGINSVTRFLDPKKREFLAKSAEKSASL